MINNLAQLKKHFATKPEFEIIAHCRPEMVGQKRKVNVCDTTGFYSVIPDDPSAKESIANGGKGSFLGWSKAPFWSFDSNTASIFTSDKKEPSSLVLSMRLC
jgi:hypothetical protein